MIHTTLCLLLTGLLISASGRAQANPSCAGFQAFVAAIDFASVVRNSDRAENSGSVDRLAAHVARIDRVALQNRLRVAGHGDAQTDVRLYLNDLIRFATVGRQNGAQFGRWILNTQSFGTRHAKMLVLKEALCRSEDAASPRTLGSGDTATTSLHLVRITLSQSLSAFNISKEARMLLQVFALLAVAIASLFALNHMIKLIRAIRLDRYACAIPAVVTIGRYEITGHINILGNRGLSFEVFDPSDPINEQKLTLGAKVTFLTEHRDFAAVLTKPYDGSAGFRLKVPFKKPAVQDLLGQSQIKPHRKLEIKRTRKMKKPAPPKRGTLALKSRSAPAK